MEEKVFEISAFYVHNASELPAAELAAVSYKILILSARARRAALN